ncbi:hypothetical protein F383_18387 [Gossypium arboreum]|uniref:Uncharacterized protein n=1 Tax=Gossypium arboreum TaxID=29729 RepID=A0A0B0NR60_GOSAR|nr:hypothetical protein F383_18387 [Gossypium arboreum]
MMGRNPPFRSQSGMLGYFWPLWILDWIAILALSVS